ncbi:SNF2 family helicase/ATPase [Cordyceps militaris CM01]|uniref:SNF2 family helicase/ATPase n=1 Tax=Cordyceps militaris (strain CM01) TaxID=983644 RepID=G3JLI4_CORMM|nr:SNF2 family helicase/ATPase [Cordyceps militaris CM01]EGX90558.1 SNF2 family helicase/ATPase [Cordyceps militaris CM01]
MGDSSPLLPVRRLYVPRTPDRELQQDTIPCSPGALLLRTTQPTQILPLTSSPGTIEVPASSPFQKPPPPRLGSRLAPAGTVFRPPVQARRPVASSPKRPNPDTISLLSDDDEDSLLPPRGDIRPTNFKAHVSAFAYKPRADEERSKLRQIFDVLGDRVSVQQSRDALRAYGYDLEDAIQHLEDQTRKKKRRLVQGRRPKLVSPRKPSPPPPPPSSPPKSQSRPKSQASIKREVIMIEDDAYDYEEDAESAPDEDGRVLESINKSTLQELAAMTSIKENLLEPIIKHRPFANLHAARTVTIENRQTRGGGRLFTGETVVDAVQVFLDAVTAIDEVVATCEAKARTVKSVIDTWDLDHFGHSKSRTTPENGAPLTPNSISSFVPPLIPQQPALMDGHCRMKPFQLFGLNWMTLLHKFDIGCILADEMGLGKTCQVISFIAQLVETADGTRPWPNLIVVPPSTYDNWLGEFKKFAPGLSVIGYRGSQPERAQIAYEIGQDLDACHVVLATYSQLKTEADLEAMQSFGFNAAVFDEAHKMKNPETQLYKELGRIPAAWKLLLTGTPVQNNLLEMTSLLNFVNPRMFDGYMQHIQYIFRQKVTCRDISNGAFLYSERVKRARTILEPFILQRRKDQVLLDLPRKICNVVHCDMTKDQKPIYAEFEELFKRSPSQRKASGRKSDRNNVWMQFRKAALHPMLFRRHFTNEMVAEMAEMLMQREPQSELQQPNMELLVQELKNCSDFELHMWCRDYPYLGKYDIPPSSLLNSGKVTKLLQLVRQYQASGDRVLVFSRFVRLIELLREVFAHHAIDHRVLTGGTSVVERQGLVDEFNSNPAISVFLLTTGAGGTGINLTSANKIVIFDQSDNPQDDIQAESRAHRLGQTRDVEVLRLISSGTIEELIDKACQKKIELANKVTGTEDGDGGEGDAGETLESEVWRMMKK